MGIKKKRKNRTAFTTYQLNELEKRFNYQKYLTPSDRDVIAEQLGLTSTQVITWFQNRRAKLKRDVDDSKSLPNEAVKVESEEINETESNNGSADPGSILSDSKSERCSKRPSLTTSIPSC